MQNLLKRITIDPEICHRLRYPVSMILQLLGSGMSTEEVLKDYEDLSRDDILACLLYSSRLTEVKSIYKLNVA